MKYIYYVFSYLISVALMYLAFYKGVVGALYVLKFYTWFLAILCTTLLSKKFAKQAPQPQFLSFLVFLDNVKYAVLIFCFVWFGHFFTAIAGVWLGVCLLAFRENKKKLAAKPQ